MFLDRHEEDALFRHYERRLLDFCNAFKPAMPKAVVVGFCVELSAMQQSLQQTDEQHVSPRFTCAGYSRHVLQEILPEQLDHGASPQDYHVSAANLGVL